MDQLDAATYLTTTRELQTLGVLVTLVAEGERGWHTYQGISVYGVPKPNIYLARQMFFHLEAIRFMRELRASSEETRTLPTIILFHEMSAPWLLPLKLFQQVFSPEERPLYVMDTRTLPMEPENHSDFKVILRALFHSWMNKLANRLGDGRLVITPPMAKALRIPSGKLWGWWPSGVDQQRFDGVAQARKWPDSQEEIILTYIGCMHYERNLMAFSKAVARANLMKSRFRLLLVGDGREWQDLSDYASQGDYGVEVRPPVLPDLVPAILSSSHVGVLPFPDELKFQVSSPIKLFEYFAAGLPILSTRIISSSTVVGNSPCVFWADGSDEESLYQSLENLWENRHLLSEYGKVSLTLAEAWTWRRSADRLYQALLQGLKEKKRFQKSGN
ncbi:MAG: glycosyltransferase [Anaerolineales bacterium]|nr:glycosyltransferase [Anaerolineales bacterium]